jgi:hypothetical protein
MGYVARCTSLTQLSATNEDITDAGVLQLTALTNLQSLALRDCCEVTADALRQVLSSLTGLTGLDCQKSWDFTDEALKRSLALLTNLQALDIRGTWVRGHLAAWQSSCCTYTCCAQCVWLVWRCRRWPACHSAHTGHLCSSMLCPVVACCDNLLIPCPPCPLVSIMNRKR